MDLPYNVRELLEGGLPAFIGITISLILLFGVPLVLIGARIGRIRILLPLILAFLAAVLLRAFLPLESIQDVVGSRTTSFPPFVEDSVRLAAILLVPATLSCLSALAFARWLHYPVRFDWHALGMIFWLLPAWWVVIRHATTDNLVELLRDGGSLPALLALLGWLGVSLGQAMLLERTLVCRHRFGIAPLSAWLAGFAVAWGLVNFATEPVIIKYGELFSGLQFLLSPDREHYLAGHELLVRFLGFQFLFVFVIVLVQAGFVRRLCSTNASL